MEITLTELKSNLGKYVMMSQEEDILITKNGKIISRLTEPFSARKEKMEKQKIAREYTKDFKNSGIKVYTPTEFLKQMRSK